MRGDDVDGEGLTRHDAAARRRGRWPLALALIGLALAAAAVWVGGKAAPGDARAAALALTGADLAPAGETAAVRHISPPVDVAAVERGARAASLGRLPLPDSRHVAAFERADTGEQITQAVLVYDDEEQAATMERLAAPLLGSAFGLTEEPFDLPGAQDARSWWGPSHRVAAFRVGGVVTVVATTAADPARLRRLAEAARDKALAAAPAQSDRAGAPAP